MRITLQSFRKAYASWLANDNHPDVVIQANLGHAPGSTVTRKHYERAHDEKRRAAVISLEVPVSVAKKDGRWQSRPESWQSMAMPEKPATTPEGAS